MNRNVLNISIIRIGSPIFSSNLVPFPHTKSHLIVASLLSLILHTNISLNMVSFINVVLGLGDYTNSPGISLVSGCLNQQLIQKSFGVVGLRVQGDMCGYRMM